MLQTIFFVNKENENNDYLFINLVFAFFPISFVIGSLIVNLNLLLFCGLGIFYLKKKILETKFDPVIKIIFLFFIVILLSAILSFSKTLYFEGYNGINTIPDCGNTNCLTALSQLAKSLLFLRFFLLLITIYLLNKLDILNFKFFFLSAALTSILISLDIIYQYIFGYNTLGLPSTEYYNSGFFGDEYIAGGFLQRFSFFTILFSILISKNNNYIKFIFPIFITLIISFGILFSGSRMPVILFLFGLCIIFATNLKIKKIILLSILSFLILSKFIISSDRQYKFYLENAYVSFIGQAKTLVNITGIQKWTKTKRGEEEQSLKSKTTFHATNYEGLHKRVFLAALDTWKISDLTGKLLGNGIKSFRKDCWKLEDLPNYYLGEQVQTGKINRLCSNHPHNYYLEILVETGIAGLFIIITIGLFFVIFIFKNFKLFNSFNINNLILFAAIISLILETLPLKSTGSLFSTNNATYLILIASIVLAYKKLLNIKDL